MAITTLQGVLNGVIPSRPYGKFGQNSASVVPPRCTFAVGAGSVGAGGFSSATNGAVYTNASAGAMPFTNPASGNTYLAGMKWPTATGNTTTLVDFLWNKRIDPNMITPQGINSAPFPERDISGTANGDGVFVALYFGGGNANGSAAAQISYTNQNGTAGRTGDAIWLPGSPQGGVFAPFSLEDGDTGVRSVQTFTLTVAYATGLTNVVLVAFRPIATIAPLSTKTNEPRGDAFSLGMPQIYNDSCLTFIYHGGGTILGTVDFAQG
jgi:hypothetical protein